MYSSIAALALLGSTLADFTPPSCANGETCPEKYPCCSIEGTCGNGYVCLGGCDPRYSFKPGSCVAMPIYESGEYQFNGTDGIATYADYLGDAKKNAWSYLGNITSGDDNKLRVQMYEGGSGSTVYSSYFLWYGKVTARLKSSGGAGVISDIILLSDVKDEVDYEFVGYDTSKAQTNYYWQGQLDYKKMLPATVSDTENNWHEYTIDWQEDQITWSIDGNEVRTLKKEDTKNATSGEYAYPQTPCRIEFGLWPGGDSAAQGTSEWAGGKIDWHAGQGANPGYFFLEMDKITVEAYDPPKGVNKTGSTSYIYTDKEGYENSIAITDDDTVLKATDGTGDNLYGPYGKKSSSSASSSSATSSSARPSSSSASKSSASSSSASSSSAASSSSSASSSSASSSSKTSSKKTSSSSSSSDGNGAAAVGGATGSASKSTSSESSEASSSSTPTSSASSSKSSESSSSSSSQAPTQATNAAGQIAVPAVAALVPALLML